MKLPGGEEAIVEMAKFRDYCLSSTHPRGRHKARVFRSALGLTAEDSFVLQAALRQAANEGNAVIGDTDDYGTRFIIDLELQRNKKIAKIRSSWIYPSGFGPTRFLTCFVL
jgi:hypothetical protein